MAPSGPKMVFIHGVGSSGAGWPPEVLASLSAHYDVYCPTPPGAGRPLTAGGAFDLYTRAIKQAVGNAAVVVAHSMGAYLSLRTALRYPGLIGKLVLMSMPGHLPWLGAKGALWAMYFRGAGFVPWAGPLDGLVSKCIRFDCGFNASWRWPLLPTLLAVGTKTKIALMAGEHDSIAPASQGATVANLLRVPFYQVAGGSHEITAQHTIFVDSLNQAIAAACVPRPVPSAVATVEATVRRGARVSSFNPWASARRIAELEGALCLYGRPRHA